MSTELTDLAETLLSTDTYAGSWAWNAGDDTVEPQAYIDCSQLQNGTYSLEVGDGSDDGAVVLALGLSDLKEIHRQLTVQLMVARMRREV